MKLAVLIVVAIALVGAIVFGLYFAGVFGKKDNGGKENSGKENSGDTVKESVSFKFDYRDEDKVRSFISAIEAESDGLTVKVDQFGENSNGDAEAKATVELGDRICNMNFTFKQGDDGAYIISVVSFVTIGQGGQMDPIIEVAETIEALFGKNSEARDQASGVVNLLDLQEPKRYDSGDLDCSFGCTDLYPYFEYIMK